MLKKGEDVLTPGGKRPKSAVHHVQPGTEVSASDVVDSAEPVGMRPLPDPGMRAALASEEAPYQTAEEPAGMRPADDAAPSTMPRRPANSTTRAQSGSGAEKFFMRI